MNSVAKIDQNEYNEQGHFISSSSIPWSVEKVVNMNQNSYVYVDLTSLLQCIYLVVVVFR